jgi:hypothetical protein
MVFVEAKPDLTPQTAARPTEWKLYKWKPGPEGAGGGGQERVVPLRYGICVR